MTTGMDCKNEVLSTKISDSTGSEVQACYAGQVEAVEFGASHTASYQVRYLGTYGRACVRLRLYSDAFSQCYCTVFVHR